MNEYKIRQNQKMFIKNYQNTITKNWSILAAKEHLLATYLEIFPLSLVAALLINEEWYKSPYLGVFPLVFKALKSAFSAPKIWTVDAGYFARLIKDPAWEINFAPTFFSKFRKNKK